MVHRDIKPANLIMARTVGLVITDFGIARVSATNITQTGMAVGTPVYMSPEQYMGSPVDNRADIFSAGVLFYELVTGGAAVRRREPAGDRVQDLPRRPHPADPSESVLVAAHRRRGVECPGRAQREARFANTHEFARAVAAAVTGTTMPMPAVVPPSPFAAASTVDARPRAAIPVALAQADLDRAAQALVGHVGPIAKVLVRKAAIQAAVVSVICCIRLGVHLSNDEERRAGS